MYLKRRGRSAKALFTRSLTYITVLQNLKFSSSMEKKDLFRDDSIHLFMRSKR